MRDQWYGDNRDLVKWGILLAIADLFKAGHILQVAFYRRSEFGRLLIDGQEHEIPAEVITHFRSVPAIKTLSTKVRVEVLDRSFEERETYRRVVLGRLAALGQERSIVFLDPDTGLECRKPTLNHVLCSEARSFWNKLKAGDIFVLYQHRTNRAEESETWIPPKRKQLADALGLPEQVVKVANSPDIARDVAFFFAQKQMN